MIRALLFDAAGTLIEPADEVAEVYAWHATAAGLSLDPVAIRAAFRDAFLSAGEPIWQEHPDGDAAEREWWRQVVGLTLARAAGHPLPPARVSECFQELFAHYAEARAWRVFPEVEQVLARSREEGFRLAVVSNFDRRLHGIVKDLDLAFELVLTSADARARKPDPAIFLQALGRLALSPDEVLHVGDSAATDGAGARAAGIKCYLLDRPQRDLHGFLGHALLMRAK